MYSNRPKDQKVQLIENQQGYRGGQISTSKAPATVVPIDRRHCQNSGGGY